MRMIIVEGPDGAGKSTLAKQLADSLNMRYQTTGGPTAAAEELMAAVDQCREDDAIYDRHPLISDMLYKAALGKDLLVAPDIMKTMLNELKPILIYCRLHDEQLMADNMVRTHKAHKPPEYMERVLANQRAIIKGYDCFFEEYPYAIRFDWLLDSYKGLVARLQAGDVRV